MNKSIHFVLFLLLLLFILAGCGGDYSTVKQGEISMVSAIPGKVFTGDLCELNVVVDNPDDLPVDILWNSAAALQEPSRGMTNVLVKLPCEPGLVRVSCKVIRTDNKLFKGKDTSRVVSTRYLDIAVVELPPFRLADKFVMSGWMETSPSSLQVINTVYRDRVCDRFTFNPGLTSEGWGGVYWLDGADFPSAKPVDLTGYQKLTFMACASGAATVEFKVGTNDRDRFSVSTGPLNLSEEWQTYTIDLKGRDLSAMVGAFCWVATKTLNPGRITFFLSDIRFEREKCGNPVS